LLLALTASASAQERFDLRDWNRKKIEDSTTVFFECTAVAVCGNGSSVSGRLIALPKQPWTVERLRAREERNAKRRREQGEGRIKDIELGETKEVKIGFLPLVYIEKKVVPASGQPRTELAGIITGKTKAYSIVASGSDVAKVRNNFTGLARILSLVLEQMAADSAAAADD